MTIVLPICAVAFAGSCVWLTVRIVNRRVRWAKWALAAVVFGVPVLYVVSFGPACWITSRTGSPHPIFNAVYAPLWRAAGWLGPTSCDALSDFGILGMKRGSILMINLGTGQDPDWAVILVTPEFLEPFRGL